MIPKPVEPGTCDFHNPTTRLVIGMGRPFSLLLAPGPDAGDVPLVDRDPAALPVIVALVEARILRSVVGGLGSVDPDASDGFLQYLEIVGVRSGRDDGEEHASTVRERGPLRAELPPIRRIRSGGLAAGGRLGHGPIDAPPFPVDSAPGVADIQGASGHGGSTSIERPVSFVFAGIARRRMSRKTSGSSRESGAAPFSAMAAAFGLSVSFPTEISAGWTGSSTPGDLLDRFLLAQKAKTENIIQKMK